MSVKIVAPIAALCLLAGCTTTTSDPWSDGARVDTWEGLDVREMVPPLELAAIANHARSQGRVVGGGRGNGGAYVLTSAAEMATACANSINDDAETLTGCTVRWADIGGYTYRVYVSDQYPEWYRELVGTREFGHVAQSEIGMPINRAGFSSPTVGLIDRLGG
ncbi:MAG: hypothetical protein ACWA6X_13655 [Bauldia sp.]